MNKTILYLFFFIGIFLNTNLLADINSGLVAHYEFEDNTNDSSGNNFTLSTDGNTSYIEGKIGKAYHFNGIDNNLTALNTSLNSNIGTIAYWVKTNSNATRTFVSLDNSTYSVKTQLISGGDVNFVYEVVDTNNSGGNVSNLNSLNNNSWHHIAITFDDMNNTTVYYDGNADLVESNFDINLYSNLYLGHWQGSNQHDDIMDDVRIYNRVLSASDVTALYNYQVPKLTLENHGGVLQFNNNSRQVRTSSTLSTITNHTIEFWINTKDTDKEIIKLEDTTPFSRVFIDTNGKLASQVKKDSSNSNNHSSLTSINDGVWHHIAVTYKDDGNVSMYIDKNLDKTYLTSTIDNVTLNNSTLYISNNINTNGSNMMIDEVRIWNTVRTLDEIKSTANTQLDPSQHSDLVLYYNFDERVGRQVYDITANNNHGLTYGAIDRLNFLGEALYLDGVDDNITVPASSSLNSISDAISFSGWVNIQENNGTISDALLVYGESVNAGSETIESFIFEHRDNVGLRFRLKNQHDTPFVDVYNETNTVFPNKNQWYFISFTWSSSSQLGNIYVNGVLKHSQATDSGSIAYSANPELLIGKWYEDERFSKGNIRDFSLWKKALTREEILSLMNSTPNVEDTSLIAYWPLDEGKGTTVHDKSSNNNHGTLSGAIWEKSNPSIYGNRIYTSNNLETNHQLIVENNTTLATYSYNGSVPNEVKSFDGTKGTFKYINPTETTTTLNLQANDAGVELNTTVNVVVYPYPNNSSIDIKFNITIPDVTQHNITDIKLIGQEFNQNVSFNLSGLTNGDNNLTNTTTLNVTQDFVLQIITDDSKTWYYNFAQHAFFSIIYPENSADFLFNFEGKDTITIDNLNLVDNVPRAVLLNSGGALQFNKTLNEYVQIPDNDLLDPSNITVEAWYFKPPSGVGKIVNKWDNVNNSLGYTLQVNSDSRAGFYVKNQADDYNYTISTTQLANNTWYHLAGTYDGSNIKIIVNGTEENTTAYNGTINNSNANLQINTYSDPQTSGNGIVDEVRI